MRLEDFLMTREWYPKTGRFLIVQNESEEKIHVCYPQTQYALLRHDTGWNAYEESIHTYGPRQVFSIPVDAMRNEFGNFNLDLPISILREVQAYD